MFMAGFQREFVGKGSCNEILSGVGNVISWLSMRVCWEESLRPFWCG